jgi:hypothetical protein
MRCYTSRQLLSSPKNTEDRHAFYLKKLLLSGILITLVFQRCIKLCRQTRLTMLGVYPSARSRSPADDLETSNYIMGALILVAKAQHHT